ncbi:HAMP domain-containing sensor histidine kinase [Massilia sp. erpn]|uniref:sensor histidine kinase n=1 Tax=Massilia sp. erpn TaxID=2738142 RepID=UPI002106630A|nr:ATP-binding protein [Massilia sp. erpn]
MMGWQKLKHWWRYLTEPSLIKRLLLAQMALLTLLWSLGVAFVINESGNDLTLIGMNSIYDSFVEVTDSLEGLPEKQRASLAKLDGALRDNYSDLHEDTFAPRIIVTGHGREIYRSPNTPGGLLPRQVEEIETLYKDGRRWRARTRAVAPSGTRMTVLVPADAGQIFFTFNSRGFYLLPLLISIPVLLLPAWLSIRMALRPWNQVAREVASRGPQDLAPLSFKARHRELTAMVESINNLMRRVSDSAIRERVFIADAAHELRTPLAAMNINVEALQSQTTDTRTRQLLSGILNSGSRATRLVSQLLMLMRSDAAAHGAEETVALDELLQDRLAALSGLAHVRGVEVELAAEDGVPIRGQRETLVSLIDNLVENAIKYSPQGGMVKVRVRRCGPEAVLSVADQGPGIASALQERVFDRFYRDPNQTQSGSGLGLAIVKAAVEQHGGDIRLDSTGRGPGLLATVRLPLAA